MNFARLSIAAVFALLLAAGCKQEEGEVCEVYPGSAGSDCAEGLVCCKTSAVVRGICAPEGMCPQAADAGRSDAGEILDAEVPADDGGLPDAAPEDAGEPDGDAATPEVDAGPDGGADAGAAADAGVDGGPGPDAGSDAGSIPADAGTDAGAVASDAGSDGG